MVKKVSESNCNKKAFFYFVAKTTKLHYEKF